VGREVGRGPTGPTGKLGGLGRPDEPNTIARRARAAGHRSVSVPLVVQEAGSDDVSVSSQPREMNPAAGLADQPASRDARHVVSVLMTCASDKYSSHATAPRDRSVDEGNGIDQAVAAPSKVTKQVIEFSPGTKNDATSASSQTLR
jgi:hypothetical protein